MVKHCVAMFACCMFSVVCGMGGLRNFLANRNSPIVAQDLFVEDSCGQAAFDKALVKDVCDQPSFKSMMPIGLLWLNCKHSAAGLDLVRCGSTEGNQLVQSAREMQLCSSKFPSDVFFRLIHFTMLSFEACESIAGELSSTRMHFVVSKLLAEANRSEKTQKQVRKFLDQIFLSAKDLVEAQEQLSKMAASLKAGESDASRAAKKLARGLLKAATMSSQMSAKVLEFGTEVENNVIEANEALNAMNGQIESAFAQFEETMALHQASARWDRCSFPLTLAIASLVLLHFRQPKRACCEQPSVVAIQFVSWLTCSWVLYECNETLVPTTGRSADLFGEGSAELYGFCLLVSMCVTGILRTVQTGKQTSKCQRIHQYNTFSGESLFADEDNVSQTSCSSPSR